MDIENLPILILGKKRIDNVTDMNVMLEIIIVGIIRARVLLCAFFLKEKTDFLVAFLIAGSLVIIKIICLFFFDENEKYNFDENEENNNLGKIEKESKFIEQKVKE